MTFDAFIQTAWSDHADRPEEVADRLAAALDQVQAPEQIIPFARIATHVFGEHLGQWQRGIGVLQALRGVPAFVVDSDGAAVVNRSIAALRYCGGDVGSIAALGAEDRIVVLATASAAFAGRGAFAAASDSYRTALDLANAGLREGSAALRALAIGGNNLAAVLSDKPDRDAAETQNMLVAAEGGLTFWRRAGTWLEEERAHWRLAKCHLAAGDTVAACASARDCLDVCQRNDAPAFERFFGYAMLAFAQRAAGDATGFAESRGHAMRMYDAVPEDERQWCAADLGQLQTG
jgi:hypothetical protein